MLFDIKFYDRFGNPKIYTYDNLTQIIRDENNTEIDFQKDSRFQSYIERSRNEHFFTPIKHHVSELRIQLGLACNYHCRYCNQEKSRRLTEQKIKLPDSIRIRNFIQTLKDQRIEPGCIVLWGGEPLVYWKLIIQLVPALKEALGNLPFYMITNGSLLSIEKVEFLAKNRITLILSHDAQAFSTYRSDNDPLNNPDIIQAIQYYRSLIRHDTETQFLINTVITPENSDLAMIDQFFVEHFGSDVRYGFEGIVRLDYTNRDIVTKFDSETANTLIQHIQKYGTTKPSNGNIPELVDCYIRHIVNRKQAKEIPIHCTVGTYRIISTTLDGELLACHGASPSKYTFGSLDSVHSVYNNKIIPWWNRHQCDRCPFLINCLGACAILTDEEQEGVCENEQLWNFGLFWCTWYKLFDGARIVAITPHR